MNSAKEYWFKAKEYGWGWGLPATWQGWLVLIGFVVLLTAGAFPILSFRWGIIWYNVYAIVLSALLFAICWWKGEPPAWRWGKK